MRIVALSDLHGDLININSCDVVCICGDIVPLNIQRKIDKSAQWITDVFLPWCEDLPCKKVFLIGGNHDFVLDKHYHLNELSWLDLEDTFNTHSRKITLLDGGSGVEFDGKKFWGSPVITGPQGWANYQPDSSDPFIRMPVDVDVVLVHQPPLGQVGTVLQSDSWNYLTNYGSQSLQRILCHPAWDVRYLFCGHIHSGLHSKETIGHTACYNVSIKDEKYKITYPPLEIDIR